MNVPQKEVVIIGGGFAGVNLAKKLAKDQRFLVTLVDQNNFNYFVPLLYQVATGFLEPSNISYPFRKLLRGKANLNFRLGKLIRVDTDLNICYLDNGEINYDQLVLAFGAVTNYFGNRNIALNAIPMKTVSHALNMRNRLLQTLEEACITEDPALRKKLLTVVVAGGGPTGVEVAGVIAELRKCIVKKDYPELVGTMGELYLIEGSSRLLSPMSSDSQCEAYQRLTHLGVKIIIGKSVQNFEEDKVTLSDQSVIESRNLIWAAGITVEKIEGIPVASVGKGNRLLVDEFNRVNDTPNVFAIGDACLQTTDASFAHGHPQLAQVAIQQGKQLASNLFALADGKSMKPFHYSDKGSMAIVGRTKAVADLTRPQVHVGGFMGLMIWLFVHLNSLISWQNKAKTLFNWILAYFTRNQALRLIIWPSPRPIPLSPKLPIDKD
jgi:NADH:ubiquinone reductase (H+-translocating)